MKNVNVYIILFAMFSIALMSACKDELESNNAGLLEPNQFFTSDEDAIQGTAAAYDILQWHFNNGWSSPYLVKTLPSDEGQSGGGGDTDQPFYQQLDKFTYDPTNGAVLGAWRLSYYGIARCNTVINNANPDSEIQRRSIAEAKSLRAYYYMELVAMFGAVPLVTELLPPDQWNVNRTSADSIYMQIESDLTEAIPDLPLKSQYDINNKFRISKGTAQSLLGKAYLFQEKWAQAAQAFEQVISSGEYDLDIDFAHIWTEDGELGIESVFEVVFVSTGAYTWGNFPWGEGRAQENNIHLQLMGPRGDFFTGVDTLVGGWGFNLPSEDLYNAFVNAGDTVRRYNTVWSEQELRDRGGDWSEPNAWDYQGYIRTKYGTYVDQTNTEFTPELNYGTNWRLIRYADVLLMAAEAYHNNGSDAEALVELNKVRARVGLPAVNVGGQALMDAIILERQLELAFEGFRYLDLVRWDLANATLSQFGFKAGKHELFPIPDTEIRIAPNLAPNNPQY